MIIQNVVTKKYTWTVQNLVVIAATSHELLPFPIFGVYIWYFLFWSLNYTPARKKMNSIIFLFLEHCGFQKCITFPSNKKFAQKSIFEHQTP